MRARVRLERSDDDQVDIVARSDGEREPLAIEEHGDTVTVREIARAAIDLRVPRGTAVRVTTVSGPIDARALEGELDARTVSGPIKARVVGDDPHKHIGLHTVSGPVLVDFADGASAHVHVETVHGHIAGDGGVRRGRDHRRHHDDDDEDNVDRGRKSFDARVGDGGGEVRVDTVTGPVKLRHARAHAHAHARDSDD